MENGFEIFGIGEKFQNMELWFFKKMGRYGGPKI